MEPIRALFIGTYSREGIFRRSDLDMISLCNSFYLLAFELFVINILISRLSSTRPLPSKLAHAVLREL